MIEITIHFQQKYRETPLKQPPTTFLQRGVNKKPHECGAFLIEYYNLLQQHHLPGLYKLTCTNLIEVDTSTNWLAMNVCSIPLD